MCRGLGWRQVFRSRRGGGGRLGGKKGGGGWYLVYRSQQTRHPRQVADAFIQPFRALDREAVDDLRARDGRLHGGPVLGLGLLAQPDFLDQVDDVGDAGAAQPELLLAEPPVLDAGDQVVEALALDDVVERDEVAFLAVAGEEVGVFELGDPEEVAEREGADEGPDAVFVEELGFDVGPIFPRADFAVVED